MSYVNTTAEVKAESDYCCTSGNAVEIVNSIPADKEILFLPDMFLGAHVRRVSGRKNMHVWMGECHVHAGIDPEDIRLQRAAHPGAEFLIHPECGCATSVVEAVSAGDIDPAGVQILSTEGMIKRPKISPNDEFIVATEVGILHRLRRENPTKTFYPANPDARVRIHEGDDAAQGVELAAADGAPHHGARGDCSARATGDRADGRDRQARRRSPRSPEAADDPGE